MERKVFCRKHIFGDVISFFVRQREGTSIYLAAPLTMNLVEGGDCFVDPEPTFNLRPEEAQALMDSLWDAGLRPSEGSGSAGAMAATQKHLEDMRTLIFNPPAK
jgi:hypothetical protein